MSASTSNNTNNNQDLIELLLRRQAELNALLEITQAINKNASGQQLIEMLELILKTTLKVGKFHFFLKADDRFICMSHFGGNQDQVPDYSEACQRFEQEKSPVKLSSYEDPSINQFDYFIPVHHKDQALACALIGDMRIEEKFIDNIVNYIQTLANVIVVAFENKKLFKERIQRERWQKEVELASHVQNMFIPQSLPKDEFLDVDAVYLPHESIGGDFFDFIELNANEVLWCIADVSGKGISAALLMANFQASLKALATQKISLSKLLKRLNRIVYQNTKGDRFITLFIARYHKQKRTLKYINAGHNPSILIRGEQLMSLTAGSTMIGAFEELPFVKEEKLILKSKDIVFNYTDGLIEFDGEDHYNLSEQDFHQFIVAQKDLPLAEINKNVMKKSASFRNNSAATDDITLLSLRFF